MDDSANSVEPTVPRDRWRLIYNGLDLETFGTNRSVRSRVRAEWGLQPSTIAIGTASSISPRKRLGHFVKLIGELSGAGLDVRGFIAGQPYFPEDEDELRSLRALTASLGLEGRLTFLGYVEPSEPLYHAWDVCVSTSAYETFGMTVLEAMACGCPVVAYPGGSVEEVLGDGGVLVEDQNLPALVGAVRGMVTDPARRSQSGATARARASRFDLRKSVDLLVSEYRSVLGAVAHGSWAR